MDIYINSDELEKAVKKSWRLECDAVQLEAESEEVLGFIKEHRPVKSRPTR